MLDKLVRAFCQKGYMRLVVAEKELRVVFRITAQGLYFVCLTDDTDSFLKDRSLMPVILANVRQILQEKYQQYCSEVTGLALVLTNDPRKTKECMNDADNYWLLHVPTRRLMVFDNQPWDFFDARAIVEEYLNQTTLSETVRQLKRLVSPVNIGLILVNVLVFVVLEMLGSTESAVFMHKYGAVSVYDIVYRKEYWRLLTSGFLHFGLAHLLPNMLVLLYLGKPLEEVLGSVKYLVFYLICAVASDGLSILWYYSQNALMGVSAGASGAICGVAGGLVYVLLRNRRENDKRTLLRIFIFVAILMSSGVGDESVNVSAHVSGMIVGFLLAILFYHKPKARRAERQSEGQINNPN